jgi:DNA polymerase
MYFESDPHCERCSLHNAGKVTNVCVPARPLSTTGNSTAVLVVGEAPGRNEDRENEPFVGQAGEVLDIVYMEGHGVYDLADVYVTNAVRCRPPENSKPNKGHLNACLPYLKSDIEVLEQHYEEVVLLCVGATATQQVLGTNLKASFRRQGELVQLREPTQGKKKK